jgi:transcriptional activator of cad operon
MENNIVRIGEWRVDTSLGKISRGGETVHLEVRTMKVLMCLAMRAGAVVSIDDLLDAGWEDVAVSPDSVYQAVASLRRALGDDPKQPTYIATVPRLGYRMVARVGPWVDDGASLSGGLSSARSERRGRAGSRVRAKWVVALVVLLGAAVVVTWALLIRGRVAADGSGASVLASQNQRSIAVLPFLDLTDGMKEEEFADGMTEELIDRLSKISDFRVPAATVSFYYKGKQVPLPEIAKQMNVVYVLDGSVRKSSARFRVAARLVRAENGYVMWSEDYDRPMGDKLWVQEDIAAEVAKALRASIEGGTPTR